MAAFRVVPDSSGATAWDNAVLSTRLGEHPQLLVTTTPKRTPIIRELFRQSTETGKTGVVLYSEATLRNRANLSPEYIRAIHDRYKDTHLERQELHGELVGDSPGALWRSEDIVVKEMPEEDNLVYVIGVDPSVGPGGSTTDDCGIVVVAATPDQDIYKRQAWVVEDLTINAGPEVWTDVILDAQERYTRRGRPAIVVCEGNQGGELLRLVLNQKKPGCPIAIVKAVASKAARAEPVVMAYRQKRVFHVEQFPKLEDEQTGWEPENTRGWSPGALDACVWGCHVLLVDPVPLYPYAPIIASARAAQTSLGQAAVPGWRSARQSVGLAIAPWRRR
jgi:phage terminase large subunit-like protein